MIKFDNALILDVHSGVTKNGQPYTVLRFLNLNDYSLYDGIWQFGDSAAVAAGLSVGSTCQLGFLVVPNRNGGVSLRLEMVGSAA